ncbi:hypothetical protein XA68_12211 [Ophiocordyceps unilateralis]|uniref:Uncharacterized protein n=1 Tax=Ophiocordyceps unilateralis TaxID=268505 RepID=A0A2A9PEA1_OPHUN|nr:hypothetical protein XA68_12211 [Ophiocordyceps unilateralis]
MAASATSPARRNNLEKTGHRRKAAKKKHATSTAPTMAWLGIEPLKKFPAPFLKPMAPFFAAGVIIAYGVNSLQGALMETDEWKNDPRNPKVKAGGH